MDCEGVASETDDDSINNFSRSLNINVGDQKNTVTIQGCEIRCPDRYSVHVPGGGDFHNRGYINESIARIAGPGGFWSVTEKILKRPTVNPVSFKKKFQENNYNNNEEALLDYDDGLSITMIKKFQESDESPPKPGKVLFATANHFKMIELSPGSGVYVFDKHIDQQLLEKVLEDIYKIRVFATRVYRSWQCSDSLKESIASALRHTRKQSQTTYDRRTANEKKKGALSLAEEFVRASSSAMESRKDYEAGDESCSFGIGDFVALLEQVSEDRVELTELSRDYTDSVIPGALLAAMKDVASVNKAALQQVKFFFPQLLDVTCFSHTIDNVGKHFEFRVLDTFAQYWVSMFSHSAAVRLAWKTKTGTAMRSYSPTRWWSKWETMKQVLDYFGDVEPFLRENDQLVPATRVHLLEIFNSPADSKDLELELAAFVDGGNHFVSAKYYLEGDGPLVFSCYERLATVSHSVALANYPNVEGVARRQANGNVPVFNQLVARAKACINPGLQFYQRKFSQEFYDIVRAFRSARLCCPVQVQQLHPTVASVEELRKFSFLDDDGIIQGLTAELPRGAAVRAGGTRATGCPFISTEAKTEGGELETDDSDDEVSSGEERFIANSDEDEEQGIDANYAALDGLLELRGVKPYFPLAFAQSRDEPLQFNFDLRVLDGLRLPCSLTADAIHRGQDEPVSFASAEEAIGYLQRGISEWTDSLRNSNDRPDGHGVPLSIHALFFQEGRPLGDMLTSGKAELDVNLDKSSDGFAPPFCFHSKNRKGEVISLTSLRLVKELFSLLSEKEKRKGCKEKEKRKGCKEKEKRKGCKEKEKRKGCKEKEKWKGCKEKEKRKAPDNESALYATRIALGWTIAGKLDDRQKVPREISVNFVDNDRSLLSQVECFWKLDKTGLEQREGSSASVEDHRAEDILRRTTKLVDGHYETGLLWKDSVPSLPNNRRVAEVRLTSLKRKFQRDPDYMERYRRVMQDYIDRGYARKLSDDERKTTSQKTNYLPYHGVTNPNKPGKVRVVFDAAAKCQGTSLNDNLLQGPDMTNNLLGVLLRFRQQATALVADVEAMFHQVKVAPDDQDAFRFLWWGDSIDDAPQEYVMTVHVFGATDSPCCANYCLRRTAEDNKDAYDPEVVDTILRHFYVDDMLKALKSEEIAIQVAHDMMTLLANGGFKLTRFMSNSRAVLEAIPEEKRATPTLDLDLDKLPVERALGVSWNVEEDTFGFKVLPCQKPDTMRGVLSYVSSFYDPQGLAAPVVLPAKQILQECWKRKWAWDKPLEGQLLRNWQEWKNLLPLMTDAKVPRCLFPPTVDGDATEIQLHHFCDASEVGYGTSSYVR
ncbi:hypothetical protein QZH41_002214 [Actinostola sp. cb2023]|nr:hypothetical protein QZH41_002214 [Actinostola sp. cb2023]